MKITRISEYMTRGNLSFNRLSASRSTIKYGVPKAPHTSRLVIGVFVERYPSKFFISLQIGNG